MASLGVKYSGGLNSLPFGSPGGTALSDAELSGAPQGAFKVRKEFRIGSWNVRGLRQEGKLYILEKEMRAHNLMIMGIAETHWRGAGHFRTNTGSTVYFSGNNTESRNGVAIMVQGAASASVLGYKAINDRIMMIKVKAVPLNLNIIQVYAPTAEAAEEVIDEFYAQLQSTIREVPRKELLIIQGDLNAKVGNAEGEDAFREVIGKFGLGTRNERGERLLRFCQEHGLIITNTLFQHHPRRRYTWKSPGDRYRNQIDFIMIGTRWRTSVTNCKTYPGADCGSDHQLLVMTHKLKLKNANKQLGRTGTVMNEELVHFAKDVQPALLGIQEECKTQNVEQIWESLKLAIKESADKSNKKRNNRRQKIWISAETMSLIDIRRKLKGQGLRTDRDQLEYKRLSKQIQRKCRQDKNSYIQSMCSEIEQHYQSAQTGDMFRKIRLLTRKPSPRTLITEDRNGKILWKKEEILERWREYCAELYSSNRPDNTTRSVRGSQSNMQEPDIMKAEIEYAMNYLKTNRAPGSDEISAEMLKSLGNRGIDIIWKLCNKIWQTGIWPKDWTQSVFIPLHKKGSTQKCQNYRTISLISHASKILLKIIDQRLRSYLEHQIPPEQAGFVPSRGTRDQIFNIRQLIEKAREFNSPMIMCFIDYKKAFDSVEWHALWGVLTEMGVPDHLTRMISSIYESHSGIVRLENDTSKPFCIQKGVRQGCILSPRLFNIYGEYIMRRALNEDEGISIGGRKLSNLRYADDTTLLAKNMEDMRGMLERITEESRVLGLEINMDKTKMLIIDRNGELELQNNIIQEEVGQQVEVVEQFNYLGALITNKGDSEPEIRRRMALARKAVINLTKIWSDKQITRNTKRQIMETLVFPIFSYGAESWTIKAADGHRIDAFEMWCWRRMLRVPWTQKRSNVSILEEIGVQERLVTRCRKNILRYFGHVTRRDETGLEKLTVQGKIEGKRPRGRSPRRWLDQVREITGCPLQATLRMAIDRNEWRRIVRDST